MSYSKQIRRLVKASRSVIAVDEPEDELELEDIEPQHPEVGVSDFPADKPVDLLTAVPLDGKRGVELESMDSRQLTRAWEQAKKRIERTRPSADLDRYKQHLASIEAYMAKLDGDTSSAEPEEHAPVTEPDRFSQPTSVPPPDPDPPRFASHPGDTYQD